MSTQKLPGIPVRLLVLDAIGTVLLVLGLMELFNPGDEPPFPGYGWVLTGMGLLIMLPAIAGIVSHLLKNRPRQ